MSDHKSGRLHSSHHFFCSVQSDYMYIHVHYLSKVQIQAKKTYFFGINSKNKILATIENKNQEWPKMAKNEPKSPTFISPIGINVLHYYVQHTYPIQVGEATK